MRHRPSTRNTLGFAPWKGVTLVAAFLVLCTAIGFLALDARRQVLKQASDEAASLLGSIGHDLSRDMGALEHSVEGVAQHLQDNPKDMVSSAWSPQIPDPISRAARIYVLDRSERFVAGSSLPSPNDVNPSTENDLRTATGLRVGFVVASNADGRPNIRLSRRIDNPDGSVRGVVVGTLQLPDVQRLILARWPHAALALRRGDGQTLILGPARPFLVDRLSVPGALAGSIKSDGEYQGTLIPGDSESLISFRRIETLPTTLSVGLPLADIYAEWRLKAIAITIVLGTFLGIAMTLAVGLNAELRRRTIAEDALAASVLLAQEANQQLTLSEKIARVGHWRIQLATGELTWSDETYRIHGVDRATINLDLDAGIAAYHVDDRAEVRSIVEQTIAAKGSFDFGLRIVRPDGEVRRVACRGLCELDGSNRVKSLFGRSWM